MENANTPTITIKNIKIFPKKKNGKNARMKVREREKIGREK